MMLFLRIEKKNLYISTSHVEIFSGLIQLRINSITLDAVMQTV
jgi:hypothetical protein